MEIERSSSLFKSQKISKANYPHPHPFSPDPSEKVFKIAIFLKMVLKSDYKDLVSKQTHRDGGGGGGRRYKLCRGGIYGSNRRMRVHT